MAKKPKKKVRTTVYEAEEVAAIAEELIPEFHGTLRGCSIEYVCITREDANTDAVLPPRAQDAARFGRIEVANKADLAMDHWHFRMVVNGNWWEKATDEQKVGAVDTLLAQCWMNEDRPVRVRPDVQGVFLAVFKRRGAWSKELEQFEAALAQQTLALDGGG